jgi:hypothetical protein
MLTHSSAAVGCIPTVESKWDFLAPALRAMAMPCMISAASGPTMCAPSTCSAASRKVLQGSAGALDADIGESTLGVANSYHAGTNRQSKVTVELLLKIDLISLSMNNQLHKHPFFPS